MPERPTVVLVSDAAGYGGAQVYLSQLVAHLGERWRFVVLLGEHAADETERRLLAAGAEVQRIRGLRRVPSATALWRLGRELRRLRPALVHVGLTDQGDGLVPLVAARLARCTAVATLHLVIPRRARARELVSTFALRLPRLVIGVSESVAAYARSRGARAVAVLNGIDPPVLLPRAEARAALGIADGETVVGGLGRIDDQKGWDVLCDAIALARTERPDVVGVVVGDGPGIDVFRSRGDACGVRFVGYREGASSYLSAFDVLAVPSRYEAFGRVAAEAMLARVAVVASAVDGLPEVVGDTGVLVPPDRADRLAAGILELVGDDPRRASYADRGYERAAALFTAEQMIAGVERTYRELVA